MHSVLLVDDEEVVRKGLRGLVDWDELGVERLGEAWNGEAALREMERAPFDVVVTDVVMPVMNGLELVRAIRERWPQTVVIVVSGHDDFPYVREAMRHGILDYILKPIDTGELTTTLHTALQGLAETQHRGLERREGELLIREHILTKLLAGTMEAGEVRQKAAELGIRLPDGECWVLLVRQPRDAGLSGTADPAARSASFERLKARVDAFGAGHATWLSFQGPLGHLVVLGAGTDPRVGLKEADRIVRALEAAGLPRCVVTVGTPVGGVLSIAQSYQDALDVESCAPILSSGGALSRERIKALIAADGGPTVPSPETLAACLRDCDSEGVLGYFARLSDYLLAVKSAAEKSTRGVLVEVYIRIRDAMRERMVAAGRVLDEASDDPAALGAARPEEAAAQLRAMALRVCAAVRAREGGSGEVVHRVLQHIRLNFQESMSLKTLAERVGLRPVHLGQLIKEETGTLFTTYLNRLRIDRAKELLCEAGRRPNEVARTVGYADANYFYKVFRKQTGMTPTEFASRRELEGPAGDRKGT